MLSVVNRKTINDHLVARKKYITPMLSVGLIPFELNVEYPPSAVAPMF